MASYALFNVGLNTGWTLGEDGWKAGGDYNWLAIDTLLQGRVMSVGLNTPPAAPNDGECYIVGTAPTGVWAGHADKIMIRNEATWVAIAPLEGWEIYDRATDGHYEYTGSAWVFSYSRKVIAASAIPAVNQAIPNAVTQKIELANEEFDYGSFFDPVTSRFTPTVPGIYEFVISAGFFLSPFPAGKRLIVYIYKNGVSFKAYTESSQDSANNQCETVGYVEANGTTDYFELYARHDTGSALVEIAGTSNTRMQMVRIGGLV